MKVIIVAAMDLMRGIGKDNELLYKIPQDVKRFKEITMGKTVIMGRKTWESIDERYRPLAGRDNIVLSTKPGYEANGARVFKNFDVALREASTEEVCIIGGQQVYDEALDYARVLEITEIKSVKPADAKMPVWDNDNYVREVISTGVHNDVGYEFVRYTLK